MKAYKITGNICLALTIVALAFIAYVGYMVHIGESLDSVTLVFFGISIFSFLALPAILSTIAGTVACVSFKNVVSDHHGLYIPLCSIISACLLIVAFKSSFLSNWSLFALSTLFIFLILLYLLIIFLFFIAGRMLNGVLYKP